MECFDYSHNLNVICTGGVDHAVRLWNPYVTVKPVAIMKGHQSSIIDLAIHEALEQVFSYDKDGVKTRRILVCFYFSNKRHVFEPLPFILILKFRY